MLRSASALHFSKSNNETLSKFPAHCGHPFHAAVYCRNCGGQHSKKYPMTTQIEILDYETHPIGQRQELQQKPSGECRWRYSFPFWIDYAVEGEELARPLRCDFSDVCEWAMSKGHIEDYSIETKEGWVLIPGTSHVEWSPWQQDVVETFTGRYFLTFEQFLREFLSEKDLIEFITNFV